MILNSHHVLSMVKRIRLEMEAQWTLKSYTCLSNLLVTTHSTIIAVMRSLCPVGVCHMPRGLGTGTCYITDPVQPLVYRRRQWGCRFTTFFKVTQLDQELGFQWSSQCFFFLEVLSKCQRFLYYFRNSCPSCTPVYHQRYHHFKCRLSYVNNS